MPRKGTHISRETGYTEAEVQALLHSKGGSADPTQLFEAMKPLMLDFFLPVGTVIECVDNVHPKDKYGGEWEQIKDVFTLAAGDTYAAGSTGGEAEHTLTADESGQKALTITGGGHSHTVTTKYRKIFEAGTNRDGYYGAGTADGSNTTGATIAANTGGHTHWVSASDAASAHNNMPPYLVVYKWKRIA